MKSFIAVALACAVEGISLSKNNFYDAYVGSELSQVDAHSSSYDIGSNDEGNYAQTAAYGA